MMHKKNIFFIYTLLLQFFSLYSSYDFSQAANNIPYVEMSLNQQDKSRSNSYELSCGIRQESQRSPYNYPANYSVVEHCASNKFREYFVTVITSKIYDVTVKNHHSIIPGHASSYGLSDCINQLSQFSVSDAAVIESVQARLYSYCGRIENVLFDAHGLFHEQLSYSDTVALVNIYADFLKEFYAQGAPALFYEQSKNNRLMQKMMPVIDWRLYDGKDYTSCSKTIAKRNAGCVNGNLGKVYKALEVGDSEQAYALGQQLVQIKVPGKVWGKTESTTSVFEKYPALHKLVEQKYLADRAKIEQQQVAMQEKISALHWEYKMHSSCEKIPLPVDLLLQRCNAANRDTIVTFSQKLHKLSSQQSLHINHESLTSDRKGILFEGCHLQHQLVDEAVSVIDSAIDSHLVENLQDAVVDLANTSLMLNKQGNIVGASRTLDACWAVIDFGKKAASYVYTAATTHVPLIAQGMYEGATESLHGAAHVICDPVKAVQEAADAFVKAGYYLGRAVCAVALHDTACEMIELNPERVEQEIREYSGDPTVFFAVYEMAKDVSPQHVARIGTKTAIDIMLLHGATKVASAIVKEAVPFFLSCMRKGKESTNIAIAAEGIPLQCAEELNALMENVQNVGGAEVFAEAVTISSRAQKALDTFKIIEYDPIIGDLNKLERAVERLRNIPGALENNGPLLKALECGKKVEFIKDVKAITEINKSLGTARGAMYEIEKALDLMEAGEKIVELGGNFGGREFDIVTQTKYIECKNIDWINCIGGSAEKMKSNLGHCKKIAENSGKMFELYSKNPISKIWKDWLIEKGIKFVEDNFL